MTTTSDPFDHSRPPPATVPPAFAAPAAVVGWTPRDDAATAAPRAAGPGRRRVNWPLWFVVAYIGCQVALLFLGSTPLRTPMRVGAFSISLLMLGILPPGRVGRHPALKLVPLVLLSLVPGLFMPGQPSIVAALAGATIYLSVLAPLIWGSGRPLSVSDFRKVALLLWAFNTLSAAVGVVQVTTGRLMPEMSTVLVDRGSDYLSSLTIELANGTRAFRPMGLTDQPGGASNGGMYAVLFGVGLVFTERRWPLRLLAVAGMVIGLVVIYLTHIRVTLVITALGTLVIAATFAARGDLRRTSTLAGVVLGVIVVGTTWAFTVGGADTTERFASLLESRPTDVYSQNRGYFLQDAFGTQLVEHPFGQGLGRWGMIGYYFGNPGDSLWAEIMWSAWLYDGGVPLMVLYCALVAVACVVAWQIGTAREGGSLVVWGSVVLAYNVAAMAATFDTALFGTQSGIELWFLNACLFNAWANRPKPAGGRPVVSPTARPPSLFAAGT